MIILTGPQPQRRELHRRRRLSLQKFRLLLLPQLVYIGAMEAGLFLRYRRRRLVLHGCARLASLILQYSVHALDEVSGFRDRGGGLLRRRSGLVLRQHVKLAISDAI